MDMRARVVWCVVLVTLATATGVHAQDSSYYLALGDSLAIGIQPAANGSYVPTNQGYVDDLYAELILSIKGRPYTKRQMPY
jgi:hypothetical protein